MAKKKTNVSTTSAGAKKSSSARVSAAKPAGATKKKTVKKKTASTSETENGVQGAAKKRPKMRVVTRKKTAARPTRRARVAARRLVSVTPREPLQVPWRSIALTVLTVAMLAVATMLALSLRSSWARPADPLAAQRHDELIATADWLGEKIDSLPPLQGVDQKLEQLLANTASDNSSEAEDIALQQAVARLEELAKKIEASSSSPPPQADSAAVQTQLGEIAQKLDQLTTKLDREPAPMKDSPPAVPQTPPVSSPAPPASTPTPTPPASPPPKPSPEPSPPPEPLPPIPLSETPKPATSDVAAVPVSGSTEKPAEQVSRSSELLKPSEEIALRKQRQQDWQQMQELIAAQQWDEASAAVQKIVDLDHLVNGDDPDKLSQSITTLATLHEQREEFEAALARRQEVAELLLKSCSEQDRRVIDASLSVGWVETLIKLSPEQRKQLADAKSLVAEVQALFKQGRYDEALPKAEQAKEIRKQVLGEKHFLYAQSLSDIALLHDYAGRLKEAEPFYNESAAIRLETYGESHPVHVGMLGELYGYYQAFATAQENQGDLMDAAQAWRKMADIGVALYGDEHWQTKDAKGNLQRVERRLTLLELPQEKLDMLAEANQLDQQAAQLFAEQKTDEAIALFQKVIDLRQGALGPSHAEVAKAQVRLASLYFQLKEPDKSGPVLQQALAIYRADTAQANPEVAASMMNIAVMQLGVEENDKVDALIEEALNIYRTAWGKDNPLVADFMAQRAQSFLNYGAITQGESLYQGALSTYKTSLGAEHDRYKNAHDKCLNDYRALTNHFAGSGDELTAGNFRQLIVDLLVERYGESNWRVADARRELQPGQNSRCLRCRTTYLESHQDEAQADTHAPMRQAELFIAKAQEQKSPSSWIDPELRLPDTLEAIERGREPTAKQLRLLDGKTPLARLKRANRTDEPRDSWSETAARSDCRRVERNGPHNTQAHALESNEVVESAQASRVVG